MSEEAYEKLLLEEQKNALEHLRFLETKRDRFVIGSMAASGAVLALIAQVLSKDGFQLRNASIEFIAVLAILCLSLGVLSWLLRKAYGSLSPVAKHYENVVGVTRSIIYGQKLNQSVKIKIEEKPLIEWLDTRENESIAQGRTPVSNLSESVLSWSCALWFLAGVGILVFLFSRSQ